MRIWGPEVRLLSGSILFLTTTGEMAEWSNAADSKSAIRVSVSGVRIPLSPRLLLFSDELEVVDDCNCLNPVRTEVAAVGMVTLRLFNFKGAKEFFYCLWYELIGVQYGL